jgi:endonuclease/exonuclease/phosphatase family metal-dependent hydrolase
VRDAPTGDVVSLTGGVMPQVYVALLLLVFVAISTVAVRSPAGARKDPGTFRVATFNIHKGADKEGEYGLARTIAAIAALNADLVGVQEALRNHAGFDCDDQPALITKGLRRLTGLPWTHAYVEAWLTDHTECLERGRGDETESEGLAFFAPEPIVAVEHIRLSKGRIGLMARVASMPRLPVVVTHLSASRRSQLDRAQELMLLLPWARARGPGLLMGDFNALPEARELAPAMVRYRDAWVEAVSHGRTRGVESGSTYPGRREARLDFVLKAVDLEFPLVSVEVVDTSLPGGFSEVSDHRPVVATFRRDAQQQH